MIERIVESVLKQNGLAGIIVISIVGIFYVSVREIFIPMLKKRSASMEDLIDCTHKLTDAISDLARNTTVMSTKNDLAHREILQDTKRIINQVDK